MDLATEKKLSALRKNLLGLHKILLDYEKKTYEATNGAVASPGQLLNLVMYDPFFDWLHRLSETVVKIDVLSENEAATHDEATDLIQSVRLLFQAGNDESLFMKKYKAALKGEPGAVIAHIELQKILLPDA